MRSPSGCTMQQSLTPEAATMVKQAINLARRRGHAQVTPIHVATVMLANSPSSLLQRACFKSHSHPLQYNALEVCFNVALNRLPTATPSPILGPHTPHYPSLSNALVAAFKRAQAHQRRGTVEAQQQPMLGVKIEAEQLVVSILDDPSVSRVLREAGFSSAHLKANVEQSLSTTVSSPVVISSSVKFDHQPVLMSTNQGVSVRNEDVLGVILSMVGKSTNTKKSCSSTVVVGECLGACESVVRAVKEKIERGDVPNELKYAQFLQFSMVSVKSFSREEVEMKLGEVRSLLKGCIGSGFVLYLGDLKWVSEYWANYGGHRSNYYCPVEHMVMGLRRLFHGSSVENGRFRLLSIASFSSYIKCKKGHPSLETLLDLHPLAIPVGSLDFSLKLDSTRQEDNKSVVSGENYSWPLKENRPEHEVKNLELSFQNMKSSNSSATESSSLPSWLLKCKEEIREESMSQQKDQGEIKELCNKWDTICTSIHKTINFSSASPSPCTSVSSYDNKNHEMKLGWSTIFEPKCTSKERKQDLLSNPNSTPNSASSSETTDHMTNEKTTELNLETMCLALEKRAPWQKEIIPDIASTVLSCRAGLQRRIDKSKVQEKQETWLFFSGADKDGKIKVAKELAKLVFGSHKCFKSIDLSSFSSPTRADSTDDHSRNKRARDEYDHNFLESFARSVRNDPHRVFYVEDVDQVDYFSQKGLKRAMESGIITLLDGQMISLESAIVIFSCESFSSTSRACSPPSKQKINYDYVNDDDDQGAEKKGEDEIDIEEAISCCAPLDLNLAVDEDAEYPVAEVGIQCCVDRQILFKIQVL
ncbi:hypothetical protein V2J09_002365 [Rumex salicifolius]